MKRDKTNNISRTPNPIRPLGGSRSPAGPAQHSLIGHLFPNWDHWQHRVSAKLWEAVALLLIVEPEKLPGLDSRPISDDRFADCPAEFKSRLQVACDHVESGNLSGVERANNTPYSKVGLAAFATWARERGWEVPGAFPGGGPETQPTEHEAADAANKSKRRGPKPTKKDATRDAMLRKLRGRTLTPVKLDATKEKVLASEYGVSRDTVRKARDEALSIFQGK